MDITRWVGAMKFFKAYLCSDAANKQDRMMVTSVANRLDIGEFQLLQIAFRQWYGREMQSDEQHKFFHNVFILGQTPAFLRHLSRRIYLRDVEVSVHEQPFHFNIHDLNSVTVYKSIDVRNFVKAVSLLLGVLSVFLLLALHTVRHDGRCTTAFPPCLTDNDLGAKEAESSPRHLHQSTK